jgi:hypothetical protein
MQVTAQLALISIASGVSIGAFLPSAWEGKARRLPPPWLPYRQGSLPATILGAVLVKVPLSLAVFIGLPYLALDYFGLIPLRGWDHQIFFVGYLLSLGAGKLFRYGYWRWTLRGQLL